MGLNYSGVHAYTAERDAIVALLAEALAPGGYRRRQGEPLPPGTPINRFLLSPPLGGWVTMLPSNDLEGREFAWAETLSQLGCPVLWLYLYESELVMYRLYRQGQLVDRYSSASAERVPLGNPRVFRPLLVEGATVEDLDRALRPGPGEALSAEERYFAIARLLGIQTAETSYPLAVNDPTTLVGGVDAWLSVEFWYAGEPPAAS
ncbi:MAG: hypothetical protein K6U89_08650 [Chloroflexi bacterium]|nr:hypothetical protein [Chloroflexota bacterium]